MKFEIPVSDGYYVFSKNGIFHSSGDFDFIMNNTPIFAPQKKSEFVEILEFREASFVHGKDVFTIEKIHDRYRQDVPSL